MDRDVLDGFHPLFRDWFREALGEPTLPQKLGWPRIRRGDHTLVLSPTGSGKTLAAFYACLEDVYRRKTTPEPPQGVQILYVSPLKALNQDVHENLQRPLEGLERLAEERGDPWPGIESAVRTGDTSQKARRRMARTPPDVLITTPESLYLILLSKARETLRSVRYVILDEVHAVLGSKRGAHLALTLERLMDVVDAPPVRIGLSATVRPVEEAARFLGGQDDAGHPRRVEIADARGDKALDVGVTLPFDGWGELGDEGVWPHVYPALRRLIGDEGSTLVFTNNRRLAERVAARLNAMMLDTPAPNEGFGATSAEVVPGYAPDRKAAREWGYEPVRAHHGSMSKESRQEMEGLLKRGDLPALVATSSLELGIDVGHVDVVALLGSPKSSARALQRVGRAGHLVGETSRGRIFPLFRDDVVESAAVVRAMREGDVEETRAPQNVLDVLAQQLVAWTAIAGDEGESADALYGRARRAFPYRDLPRSAFDGTLGMLAGRYPSDRFRDLKPRVAWDRASGRVTPLPAAKMLATLSGGTIPDRGMYPAIVAGTDARVGELDEEFVHETRTGDVFLLGSQTWRVVEIERDRVLVEPAPGEPPRMPFWRGEGMWRPPELSERVGELRRFVDERLARGESADAVEAALATEYGLDANGARAVREYLQRMREEAGVVPTDQRVVVETFRDELGDPRIVIHAPFGGAVNGPWSLVLSRRLREETDAEVQVVFNDDGIMMRLPESDHVPTLDPTRLVKSREVEDAVVQVLGDSPLFAGRFREAAERALLLPKPGPRRRTPLWLQRMRATDLLNVARDFPDFPVLLEAYRECLREAFDVDRLRRVLTALENGDVEVARVDRDVPSPFAASLLFQFVGTYLYEGDRSPGERAGLLSLNRELLDELLGKGSLRDLLRQDAIEAVEDELRGRAESPEALLALMERAGPLTEDEVEAAGGLDALPALADAGRVVETPGGWAPADAADASSEGAVRRWFAHRGPVPEAMAVRRLGVGVPTLEALAEDGVLVAGEFLPDGEGREWVDAENLARIRRKTLGLLRREVDAVDSVRYQAFLLAWHGVPAEPGRGGPEGVRALVDRYRGLSLPGEVWERDVFARRFKRYDPKWMQPLTASGEVAWIGTGSGRFAPVFRGTGRAWLTADAPEEPEDETERAVLEALRAGGAQFLADLRAATGVPGTEVGAALVRLAHAGHVTSDAPEVVSALLRTGPQKARAKVRPRRARGVRAAAAARGPYALGRWSLARSPAILGPKRSRQEVAAAVARSLLQRHGVVARAVADREALPVTWGLVARALKRMEMRGEVRRGYFVEGLSGLQFASADALATLRRAREDDAARLVSVLDPALAATAPLVDERGEAVRPMRVPSTHVGLVGARPALVSEGFGARLTPLEGASDEDLVKALKAVRTLGELPSALRPRRRLTVDAWNGRSPTAQDRARRLLMDAGFEADGGRMSYYPIL